MVSKQNRKRFKFFNVAQCIELIGHINIILSKMLTKLFFVVSLFCLCFYLYGILVTITVSEKNVCNMTYMFEYPQYVVGPSIILSDGSRRVRDKRGSVFGKLELMHHRILIGIYIAVGHVIQLKND